MDTMKILALFANPRGTDAIRLGEEDRVLQECIRLSKNHEKIDLKIRHAVTIDDARKALLDDPYDVVHFSGHGTGTGLAFEDRFGRLYVPPQDALAELLSEFSPPLQCVILNACFSTNQGTLTSLGVPFTIAMEGPISDGAAIIFTGGFYDSFAAGKDTEFSFRQGVLALKLARHPDSVVPKLIRQVKTIGMNSEPVRPAISVCTTTKRPDPPVELDPMIRPAISVCTTTKRSNPQVERMIRLLMEQTVPVSDFEYLIIDGYYHTRRDYMARLIDDLKPPFRVRYIPPKPSKWEHIRPALCNALNTSLIWAQGKLIVELDDCCIWMSPDWLEKHVEWNRKGFAVSGSWTINGWGDERLESYALSTRIGPELFYSAHRSYPLLKAIEVNGYEELLDGEQGQSDIVLALMLEKVNVRFMYDPALRVVFDAPSHTLTQLSPDPRKSRWGKEAWAVEPKKRIMNDGKPHYANEWLANEIRAERRSRPRGNHFVLNKLREIPSSLDFEVAAVQQELEQYVDTDPHDWRDKEEIAQIRGGEFVHSRDVDVSITQTQTTVKFAAISPDAKQIIVTSRNSLEKFTRTAARKRESIAPEFKVSAVCLSPLTGTVLLSSRVTRVYSADLTEFEELGESEDEVQALCVSGSESYVAAGGYDCAVHVWNFGARNLVCSFRELRGSVTALTFLGDDDHLVAGTLYGDIYLWDLGSGQELTSQKRFDCPISVVCPFSIDDKTLILVGSQDGELAICDPSSSESHPLLPKDNHRLQSIHVASGGAYAVSSGSSGEIRVWDIKKRMLLQTIFLREPVLAVHLSLELRKIFAITSVGKLLCWGINPRVAQGKFD